MNDNDARTKMKAMARDVVKDCIVVQALARFVEQIVETFHAEFIVPLRTRAETAEKDNIVLLDEVRELRAEIARLKDQSK